jgi:transcriptional regulator with XRE-family HTH domain
MSVSQLAELSNLSKAYISQVESSKQSPSQKLLSVISPHIEAKEPIEDYFNLFLQSRKAIGVSHRTLEFYKAWSTQYHPGDNIWRLNKNSIKDMLARLKRPTGLPCNPHKFTRTFAYLWRKERVDTRIIKDLSRWVSLEMVQRYTRSVTFNDSLKFYRAPLSEYSIT